MYVCKYAYVYLFKHIQLILCSVTAVWTSHNMPCDMTIQSGHSTQVIWEQNTSESDVTTYVMAATPVQKRKCVGSRYQVYI